MYGFYISPIYTKLHVIIVIKHFVLDSTMVLIYSSEMCTAENVVHGKQPQEQNGKQQLFTTNGRFLFYLLHENPLIAM